MATSKELAKTMRVISGDTDIHTSSTSWDWFVSSQPYAHSEFLGTCFNGYALWKQTVFRKISAYSPRVLDCLPLYAGNFENFLFFVDATDFGFSLL